jgi:L-arabinose isomerase
MKIGVCAVGLEAYWEQFDGMLDNLLIHHNILINKFESYDVVKGGMVDRPDKAKDVGKVFKENNVSLLFVHLTTYASSENLLPLIRELDVPVILLNVQAVKSLDLDHVTTINDWLGGGATCAGLPEMTAVLLRYEKTFDIITGYLEGDRIVDEAINEWCLAASASEKLKKGNIGVMGRTYPGMMDLNVDETNIFKRTGSYVSHINWEDIVKILENGVDSSNVSAAVEKIKNTFELEKSIENKDIHYAAEVLAAVEQLVKERNLIAMPNHFEVEPVGELKKILSVSNVVFSMLMKEGIACPVEADIKTAVAMFLLKQVAGSATLAELYSMDFDEEVCIIGHSGAADPTISSEKSVLRLTSVFHGKPGAGFVTQFRPDIGPVTMMSFAQDKDGDYRFIIMEGQIVDGKILNLGDTNARMQFGSDLRDFIRRWSEHGPTHHSVIAKGHHINVMKKVAKVLKINVIEA